MSGAETFSIRQMVELTGLSEFTIRGWENRYSAFIPQRGDTGRREYHKNDIERALLLRELLKRGYKISRIATLNNRKLKSLFEETNSETQKQLIEKKSALATQAIELMTLQKWDDLEQFIKEVRIRNASKLISEFFLPLLQALSANIAAGLVSISQEHIFSAFLKEKIYSALLDLDRRKNTIAADDGIRFILAAPEGDYHETGLLLAHLLIRFYGFKSLYMGAHTPARDLSETALRFNASHVLIVSTAPKKGGAYQEPLSYVSEVQNKVGSHLQILLAGSQAPIGLEPKPSLSILCNFQSLEKFLEGLS